MLGTNRMRLEPVDQDRCLAWRSEDGNWVWTFVLDEEMARRAYDRGVSYRASSRVAGHEPRPRPRR